MGLRDDKKATTRDAIHRAARSLLAEEGFEATTMRAVARRAGVSVGTVHNYVGSRVELVVDLFVDDLERVIVQRSLTLPDAPLVERLLHYFTGFFELYAAHPALSRTYVTEAVFAPEAAFGKYVEVTVAFLARLAAEVRATRELREEVDPFLAAQLCFDTYIGTVVFFLREATPDPDAAAAALRHRLEAVLGLMRPASPRPSSAPPAPGPA